MNVDEIRILTLWQPWASLIALGIKQYETRSWGTDYTGRLAIHAAKRPIKQEEVLPVLYAAGNTCHKDEFDRLDYALGKQPLPLGCIVAIVDLTDCLLMSQARLNPASDLIGKEYVVFDVQKQRVVLTSTVPDLERAIGNWQHGRHAWKLENVHPLAEPIPYKGGQGLRRIEDPATIEAIAAQLSLETVNRFQEV